METSSLGGSVALAAGRTLLAEHPLPAGQRSAQSLIPAVDALLRGAGRQPTDVSLIGVTIGPGSFTGLRVGVTAAKTLAYALSAQTIGVDTLDVIAAQQPVGAPGGRLQVILDAQRQELFAATFVWRGDAWERISRTAIVPAAAWLGALQAGDTVTGPAASRITAKLPAGVSTGLETTREPQAATVARLAFARFKQGQIDDFWKLSPAYFRPSAAEEKAKQ